MANARLGALILDIKGDSSQLVKEVKQARRQVSGFASGIKKTLGVLAGAAAFTAAARGISSLVTGFAEGADSAAKLARSLGTTTESITAYQFAAERAGLTQNELEAGLRRIARTASDAARGSAVAEEAFGDLGVTVRRTDGTLKSVDELLAEVADGFQGLDDRTRRAAIAQELFGRSGTGFVNLLAEGSTGLKSLTDQAREYGVVIDNEAGAASERFQDALTNLNAQATGLKNSFGSAFVQAFTPFLESIGGGKDALLVFQGAGKLAANTLKTLAVSGTLVKNAFDVVGNVIRGVGAALINFVKGDFREAKDALTNITTEISEDVGDVTAAFEAAFADPEPIKITTMEVEATATAVKKLKTNLSELEAEKALEKQAEAAKKARREAERLNEQLRARGESLRQAVRTDKEILEESLAEFEMLQQRGFIDPETFRRLSDRAREDFAKPTKESLKELKEGSDELGGSLANAFGDELSNIAQGNFDQIGQSFARLISDMASKALSSELGGLFGGGTGGGGGGLGSLFGGLFGGGGSGGGLGSLFGGFFANGGKPPMGRVSLVGERGPELFVPSTRGDIIPTSALGGVTVTNNFNVTAPNGKLAPEAQGQIAARAGSAVQRAVNRNR